MTPTQEMKDYIMQSVRNSTADNLERSNHVFNGLSDKQLDSEFGQSGITCREVWEGYKVERKLNQECINFLSEVLK